MEAVIAGTPDRVSSLDSQKSGARFSLNNCTSISVKMLKFYPPTDVRTFSDFTETPGIVIKRNKAPFLGGAFAFKQVVNLIPNVSLVVLQLCDHRLNPWELLR